MLDKRKKYLQIALNRDLAEVASIVSQIPRDARIVLEVGYPLIKTYGVEAIRRIKFLWDPIFEGTIQKQQINIETLSLADLSNLFFGRAIGDNINALFTKKQFPAAKEDSKKTKNTQFYPYIVADLKCMDRAFTEVEAAARAGASAATCLGLAPLETINEFIKRCQELKIDSVLDMMNVEYPFEVMAKLLTPPKIVMLHRGVDEGEENREKEIAYHEIARIKDVYDDVLIAVAGGETINEAATGTFNDADIIVVWRLFNENPRKISSLAKEFLKELK